MESQLLQLRLEKRGKRKAAHIKLIISSVSQPRVRPPPHLLPSSSSSKQSSTIPTSMREPTPTPPHHPLLLLFLLLLEILRRSSSSSTFPPYKLIQLPLPLPTLPPFVLVPPVPFKPLLNSNLPLSRSTTFPTTFHEFREPVFYRFSKVYRRVFGSAQLKRLKREVWRWRGREGDNGASQ